MHDWSLLHIIVREEVSKETMPARIHIKRADGSCYLPPAETNPPFPRGMAPPIILPNHFRENLHVCRQADIRSIHLTTGEATFPRTRAAVRSKGLHGQTGTNGSYRRTSEKD